MALNYIILGLIFFAGGLLLFGAIFKAPFLTGENEMQEKAIQLNHEKNRSARGFFNPLGNVSRWVTNLFHMKDKKRLFYIILGTLILILGFIAIFFTNFLHEPITFGDAWL